MSGIEKDSFICIDCETTGLDPKEDRIIEIAVVEFRDGEIIQQFESLVDPKTVIPEASIAVHNITQEMVTGQPTIEQVLPEVLKITGKGIIIGHGIEFDIDIVNAEAIRKNVPCSIKENTFIDTLRMARLYGESPVNSLEQLRKHFNIPLEGAHRAMSDVIVNVQVFKQLAKGYKSTKALLKTLEKPVQLRTMPLGKYKGRLFKDIPLQYLLWSARMDFDQDLLFSLRSEINRRKKGNTFTQASNPFSQL